MWKKFLVVMIMVGLLSGCSSPGPMQTVEGPINTPAFEPIVLYKVKDGSENVLFKEWTTMYDNNALQMWGVFFITNNGAYMASWNMRTYEYTIRYKISAKDILDVSSKIIEREYFPNSNVLVLTDKKGRGVGFALNAKIAARNILEEISGK